MTSEDRAKQIASLLIEAGWTPKSEPPSDVISIMYERWPDLSFEDMTRGFMIAGEQVAARNAPELR